MRLIRRLLGGEQNNRRDAEPPPAMLIPPPDVLIPPVQRTKNCKTVKQLFQRLSAISQGNRMRTMVILRNSGDNVTMNYTTSQKLHMTIGKLSLESATAIARRSDISSISFNGRDDTGLNYLLANNKSIIKGNFDMPLGVLERMMKLNDVYITDTSLKTSRFIPAGHRYTQLKILTLDVVPPQSHFTRLLIKGLKECPTLKSFKYNENSRENENVFYFRGEVMRVIKHETPNLFKLYHLDWNDVALDVVFPDTLPREQRSTMFISRLGRNNIFTRMGRLSQNSYVIDGVPFMTEIRVRPQNQFK